MRSEKERRALQNYILELIDLVDQDSDDGYWRGDICGCWKDCKNRCGTEQCIDRLIEYYGGEDEC